MLRPRNIDQNSKLITGGQVKKPDGGHIVNPEEVGAEFLDLLKVARGLFRRGEHFILRIGSKWTVGDAFGVEFRPGAKEFTIDDDAVWGRGSVGAWSVRAFTLDALTLHALDALTLNGVSSGFL